MKAICRSGGPVLVWGIVWCLAPAAGLLLPTDARAQADEAKVAPPAEAHEAGPLPSRSFLFPDLPGDPVIPPPR